MSFVEWGRPERFSHTPTAIFRLNVLISEVWLFNLSDRAVCGMVQIMNIFNF